MTRQKKEIQDGKTRSVAEVKAQQKYHANKTKQVSVRFIIPQDNDIIDFLGKTDINRVDLFREAIRDLIKKYS